MKKFKKGDQVRLVKYPEATGIINRVIYGKFPMVWCWITKDNIVAFAEPNSVEINPLKETFLKFPTEIK